MAHKKAGGSSRNGRDTAGRRLGHRWANHRMLYREQVHVPFIVTGPGVPVGKRVPEQVRTADIAPTLLELAGLEPFAGDRCHGDYPTHTIQ